MESSPGPNRRQVADLTRPGIAILELSEQARRLDGRFTGAATIG